MSLPKIPSINPVSISEDYPDLYITGLEAKIGLHQGRLVMYFAPYNYDEKKVAPYGRTAVIVDDIFKEAARSGAFARVLGGIVQLATLLKSERDLVKKLRENPDNEVVKAQLAGVRALLEVVNNNDGEDDYA